MTCYDSSTDKFVCALKKVKCAFASQVFSEYKKKRYGIKTCSTTQDAADLLALTEYIMAMDISGFSENTYRNTIITENCIQEEVDDGCASEFHSASLQICNISNIIEKINSL